MTGYLFALISSFFFSFYVVPRKFTKQPPITFSFFMSIGFLVGAIFLYLLKPIIGFNEAPSIQLWWCLVAGMAWGLGIVCFVKSIDCIGLSRSNQWKNLQGPIGVILTLIILVEHTSTNPLYAIIAGLCVFASAILFTVPQKEKTHNQKEMIEGILLAFISATAFGIVTVINKHVTDTVGVYLQQVVWSLSIFVSLFLYMAVSGQAKSLTVLKKTDIIIGFSSGLIYLGASFFMLQSYRFIPASIGFTIIQLNTIWTTLIGIFVFHEINVRKHPVRISLGFIFSLIGIVALAYAKR